MSVQLYRVDERLIHGQVVIGWGRELDPQRWIVVDDELAASAWEQDLYRLALDDGASAEFLGVAEARDALEGWRSDDVRTVLLTRDVDSMLRLARGGLLRGEDVNLGGIHHEPGRAQVRSYLYLDDADRERVRELAEDEGAEVSGRDLPGAHAVGLDQILGR